MATPDAPAAKILTSDVYKWIPGRFSVLHTAYGRIGELDVGGRSRRDPISRDL